MDTSNERIKAKKVVSRQEALHKTLLKHRGSLLIRDGKHQGHQSRLLKWLWRLSPLSLRGYRVWLCGGAVWHATLFFVYFYQLYKDEEAERRLAYEYPEAHTYAVGNLIIVACDAVF